MESFPVSVPLSFSFSFDAVPQAVVMMRELFDCAACPLDVPRRKFLNSSMDSKSFLTESLSPLTTR